MGTNSQNKINVPKREQIRIEKENCSYIMELVGGPAHLSKMLNIPIHVTSAWKRRGRISKNGAIQCSKHPFFIKEGITATAIRLDCLS